MTMIIAVASALAIQPAPDLRFCERLAPQLGMKPIDQTRRVPRREGWSVNLLGGLGPALFGGTAMASFSLHPIDDDSKSEEARLKDACAMTTKGALCTIDGPARLYVGTKHGKASAEALPGEHAEVEMRSTKITCYNR